MIRTELEEIRDKYGEERKTEISAQEAENKNLLDLIADEDCLVTISHRGYIKRLPMDTFSAQHRGGKGVKGSATREEDFTEHFFTAKTHDYLLCFTNQGQLYWLRVVEIPEGSRTSMGRAMPQVLSLRPEEKITSVIPVRELDVSDQFLIMATRKGRIKKTVLSAYRNVRVGGIIGISLDEDDQLVNVALVKEDDEVMLCTKEGLAIRFSHQDARAQGRTAQGVKGITLKPEDEVVGMVVADPEGYLLSVCENGYGKRTAFGPNQKGQSESEDLNSSKYYRTQRRGGKGIVDIKTTARNGKVVGVIPLREGDDVMIITSNGMVNRTHAREISVVGRNTQGVRVMNVNEGDKVAVISPVVPEEDLNIEGDEQPQTVPENE